MRPLLVSSGARLRLEEMVRQTAVMRKRHEQAKVHMDMWCLKQTQISRAKASRSAMGRDRMRSLALIAEEPSPEGSELVQNWTPCPATPEHGGLLQPSAGRGFLSGHSSLKQ